MKRHKFGAARTVIDGKAFPSKLEGSVYALLTQRVRAGELRNLRLQASVDLHGLCPECKNGHLHTRWKVDFSAEDVATGRTVYFEAKGVETRLYKRQIELWKANPPGRLEVWKGSHQRPALAYVIEGPEARP